MAFFRSQKAPRKPKAMQEMNVEGIAIDSKSQPVVILTDWTRTRALPIWIGMAEAAAISKALADDRNVGRPATHELTFNIIDQLGYQLDHLEINELIEGTFHSKLCLLAKDELGTLVPKVIDCRPSDGIAIAAVAHVPIMVSPEIIESSSMPMRLETATDEEVAEEQMKDEDFHEFLNSVTATDFTNFAQEIDNNEPGQSEEPEGEEN